MIHAHVEPGRPTPRRIPSHDIIEPVPTVNQRIEEPQRGPSRREARIVQQGDKSGNSRRRSRRSPNEYRGPIDEDSKVHRLSRDIRERLQDR
jgi:hypothetical protein